MQRLGILSRDGAIDVLRRLCLGEARFRELNEIVTNTRTLTRRLKELWAEGLIRKIGTTYRITGDGFDTAITIEELEEKAAQDRIDHEELVKMRQGWMRVSLTRLITLLVKEFGDELVSIVLYGSSVKETFRLGRSDVDLLYVLEDGTRDVWQREGKVFREFQSTWEYRACDYWLKSQGAYGYPEVTTLWLEKSYAKRFQPIYLDMLLHRAVLYDTDGFFQGLMKRLGEVLKSLGTTRVERPDGVYSWSLKPDIAPGEKIEISLG